MLLNIGQWIVVGGVMGWIASKLMDSDRPWMALNVVVGMMGALVAGSITPLLVVSRTQQVCTQWVTAPVDPPSLVVIGILMAFLGATILLAIVNLFQRGIY
jgi:uncharacterized membrane protein YeaQ/YmgE (transglycosylase-associated protein family)